MLQKFCSQFWKLETIVHSMNKPFDGMPFWWKGALMKSTPLLRVIMLCVIILIVLMLIVIILIAIMLIVIMLNVIIMSVEAPCFNPSKCSTWTISKKKELIIYKIFNNDHFLKKLKKWNSFFSFLSTLEQTYGNLWSKYTDSLLISLAIS